MSDREDHGETGSWSAAKRALLEKRLRGEAGWVGIEKRAPDRPLPLSFAQRRMWFLNALHPESSQYNLPACYRLTGVLSLLDLERSLNEIVRRHEVLRTRIHVSGTETRQIVEEERRLWVEVADLRALAAAERDARARELAGMEACRTFDLSGGPLLRAAVIRLAEDEHLLLVVMHHIVSDGWSVGVFFQELATLYKAGLEMSAAGIPPLPIQYGDFAVWQLDRMQGTVLETEVRYWTEVLAGGPAVLDLPTDHPRPAVQSDRGSWEGFSLSRDLSERLSALSRQEGVTLFATLLVALQTLLHRYTGQTDIAVGCPIANRTRKELEPLIGFFVNTLVLRTDVSGDPRFVDLLGRVWEAALGAYAHQDLPFERLVEELAPERDPSRTPLFQISFEVHMDLLREPELAGLTIEPVAVDTNTAKFDLSLSLGFEDGVVTGALEYNSDLFERGTIRRMLAHFDALLEGIASDPQQRLSELPLLTPVERERFRQWNATARAYPSESSLQDLFEAQADRTPDAVAVRADGEELTYLELNGRANQLAHALRGLGVEPETIVGICMDRSIATIVAMLGVVKAGGAYLPLDPSYPRERLVFAFTDARVRVVLTRRLAGEPLAIPGVREIELGEDGSFLGGESRDNPVSRLSPDHLAYVLYTSGSTGRPKAVMVSHGAVVNFVTCFHRAFGVSAEDRAVLYSRLTFDASVIHSWGSLTAGACVCIPDDQTRVAVSELFSWWAAEAITICDLPTAVAAVLFDTEWPRGLPLRKLLAGGEKLHRGPKGPLPCDVWNVYGPTEATVFTTVAQVPDRSESEGAPPIGRPIDNCTVFVLDPFLGLVPVGVTGELYLAGVPLGRGYLHEPALTAERYLPDPLGGAVGSRMYRTGDLVHWDADGNLHFLGRTDSQVKVRSIRIEPGEIESVLREHPAIREAVVVARESAERGSRLVCYYTPRADPGPSSWELRLFLASRLPDYMVPADYVRLAELPTLSSGKVDRESLPDPGRQRPALEAAYSPPVDDLEREVARIWQEVLQIETVGTQDNFFDLGGHSLLIVAVADRIRGVVGKPVPLVEMFKHPTVSSLARYLNQEVMGRGPVAGRETSSGPRSVPASAHRRARRERRRGGGASREGQ